LPATGKESKLGRSPIVHSIPTTGTVRFDDRAVYRQGHTGEFRDTVQLDGELYEKKRCS
jgi:hypothetical protein